MGEDRAAVRFGLLGPLRLDGVEGRLGARKQRLLVAALLAVPGETVTRSLLADVVWDGSPPPDATHALQVLVARLRRLLAPSGITIATTDGGYLLAVRRDEVDHVRFTAADVPDATRNELEEALELWRGPPFGELGDAPFLRGLGEHFTLVWERLTSRVHEARLADGDAASLVPTLARWAEDRPLDEAAWCRYATGLAAVGRTADALRMLRRHRDTLGETTGLLPSAAVTELEQRLLGAPEQHHHVMGRPLAPAELLGRATELGELTRLVIERRLVTVVGVGGVGKTRLAIAVTDEEACLPRHVVRWCDLAPLADAGALPSAACSACGIHHQAGSSATESLAAGLGGLAALLVIDNCEHVLPAVRDLVATLLAACPSLHILATSRQPLDLAGEVVLRLGPLAALDDRGRPGPAVELFMRRTRERGSPVEFDEAAIKAVVDVCRRLDGLPLAVELAAARTTALTPREIDERLDENAEILRLAHPPIGGLPRHQTLRAAIAWSYDLLEPDERRLFEDLAVFAGSFTLDAIEHVTTIGSQTAAPVLDTLEALVDRSLVVADDTPAGTRYRLLDTLRRFAAHQLEQRTDGHRVRARHARSYEAVAIECGLRARTSDLRPAQQTIELELPNLRAAFEHLITIGDVDAAQRLVAGAWRSVMSMPTEFIVSEWARRAVRIAPEHIGPATAAARAVAAWGAVTNGDYRGARRLSDWALEAAAAGSPDDGLAANVAAVQCMFTRLDRDHAAVIAERELQTARCADDPERLVRALIYRYFARSSNENGERRRDASDAVERARTLGHPGLLGTALCHLAWQHHRDGDDTAAAVATEAAHWCAIARDDTMYAYSTHLLATIAHENGEPLHALEHVVDALNTWRRSGDARSWAALHQLAALLSDIGDHTTALLLAGGIGQRNLGAQIHLRPDALTSVGRALGRRRCAELLATGATKSQDELITLALDAATRAHDATFST